MKHNKDKAEYPVVHVAEVVYIDEYVLVSGGQLPVNTAKPSARVARPSAVSLGSRVDLTSWDYDTGSFSSKSGTCEQLTAHSLACDANAEATDGGRDSSRTFIEFRGTAAVTACGTTTALRCHRCNLVNG